MFVRHAGFTRTLPIGQYPMRNPLSRALMMAACWRGGYARQLPPQQHHRRPRSRTGYRGARRAAEAVVCTATLDPLAQRPRSASWCRAHRYHGAGSLGYVHQDATVLQDRGIARTSSQEEGQATWGEFLDVFRSSIPARAGERERHTHYSADPRLATPGDLGPQASALTTDPYTP